jgi:hypothetical protein
MTVRAWVTISVVVLVVLTGATVYQFTRPLPAPPVLVRSGDVRLEGRNVISCWPQRNERLRCAGSDAELGARTVPSKGTFHLIVAYPVQPSKGQISLARGRKTLLYRDEWVRTLRYDLDPGEYTLDVQAGYPADARLHYIFDFKVTRSGA